MNVLFICFIKFFILVGNISLFHSSETFAFGPIGHRVVAQIAQNELSETAKKQVLKILEDEDMSDAANYADFIKSSKEHAKYSPWHYINLDDHENLKTVKRSEEKDVVFGIEECLKKLKEPKETKNHKFYLRLLIHFVGDIHQPLHAGKQDDKGGNSITLFWFKEATNLHRIWDEHLIESTKLSYTEYTSMLERKYADKKMDNTFNAEEIIKENISYRKQIYELPPKGKIVWEYDYIYKNISVVNERLYLAGIRLAYLLNRIY